MVFTIDILDHRVKHFEYSVDFPTVGVGWSSFKDQRQEHKIYPIDCTSHGTDHGIGMRIHIWKYVCKSLNI